MKKALVTGGAGGIGEAICRRLASDGYTVYINYAHSKKKAEEIASQINGQAVCFDISNNAKVIAAADELPAMDLLVNNAGISEIGLFTDISETRSKMVMDVNLIGAMNCSRFFVRAMIREHSGCIINISSMWGQCGASCEVDYSASKAGLIGFTKALAKEVAPSGIRVNCVAPGFILTEMNSHFNEEELRQIKEDIPLGKFGLPHHIADAVSFLASDQAEYITGQILAVNGGMVI